MSRYPAKVNPRDDRMVDSAQRQFIAQPSLMYESLAAFLPARKRSSGRD